MTRNPMEIAAEIDRLRREQVRLLIELAVSQEVVARMAEHGVSSDLIKSYGFDSSAVRPEVWQRVKGVAWDMGQGDELAHRRLKAGEEWVGPWLCRPGLPEWYNFVRLKDGRIIPLEPMIQAAHARSLPHP